MGRGKTDLDGLRADILAESLELANEPRFGYFGFAPPLGIGDTSLAPQAKRKYEGDAEAKRSFVIGAPKKGATDDVLFMAIPPLCIGDPFVDPWKRAQRNAKPPEAENVFRPAGKIQWPMSDVPWMPSPEVSSDPKEIYKKYHENDFLVLHPPNIKSAVTKKGGGGVLVGGVLMGGIPEAMPDDYDAAKKLKKAELKRHEELCQEQAFKSVSYGGACFAADREAFHCDQPRGLSRPPKVLDLHAYPHEAPFRPPQPSRKGYNGLMGWPQGRGVLPKPFPDWIPDPAPAAKRKTKEPDGPERPAFRPPHPGGLDNPQKSVMMHPRNLRTMYPQSFVRPKI